MNVIENENTEFKREYTSDIKKTVVAFANSKGGTIYIGISDDGEIIGVDDLDQTLQNALNSIRDSIKPDVSIYTSSRVKNIEGKNVIEINIQRGINRPYYIAEKGLKPSGVYAVSYTHLDVYKRQIEYPGGENASAGDPERPDGLV